MRAIYITLAMIVAFVSVAHLIWGQDTGFIRDFAPGLATEVLGILITLVFVHRILDRRAMDERARASRGGVRRAEDPLRDLSDLWTEIVPLSANVRETRSTQRIGAYILDKVSPWP